MYLLICLGRERELEIAGTNIVSHTSLEDSNPALLQGSLNRAAKMVIVMCQIMSLFCWKSLKRPLFHSLIGKTSALL